MQDVRLDNRQQQKAVYTPIFVMIKFILEIKILKDKILSDDQLQLENKWTLNFFWRNIIPPTSFSRTIFLFVLLKTLFVIWATYFLKWIKV